MNAAPLARAEMGHDELKDDLSQASQGEKATYVRGWLDYSFVDGRGGAGYTYVVRTEGAGVHETVVV